MDTMFRIFDTSSNSEIYLLQDWGSADPISVAAWETSPLSGIDNLPVCDYDVDNLKWSGKAVMNSILLDLWETIEKDVGVGSKGPFTYASVISKIQQVSASAVRSLVTQLKTMHLLAEPGQDVELFGSKIIDLTRRIEGSGRAPSDLTYIVAACFIDGEMSSLSRSRPSDSMIKLTLIPTACPGPRLSVNSKRSTATFWPRTFGIPRRRRLPMPQAFSTDYRPLSINWLPKWLPLVLVAILDGEMVLL